MSAASMSTWICIAEEKKMIKIDVEQPKYPDENPYVDSTESLN